MHGESTLPKFSVIIPTWNRAATLEKMLRAWERQTPNDLPFEIVVVDDGSGDRTSELLAATKPTRYSLVVLRQENQGPAVARNYGLAAATGEWVLYTGDDIEPSPDLLKSHLDARKGMISDRWAVLGNISWSPDLELTSTMRHVDGVGAQQFSFHYMTDGDEYDYRHFYTSNVSASRKLLEEEFTGFSKDFPAAAFEDAEFSYRLRRRGMRIVYRASARAWHHHAYDAPSFFARQMSCGKMGSVLIEKWPKTRRDIGAQQIRRSRIREKLIFGARRRRVLAVEDKLEALEEGVLELAAEFDLPATSVVDPLLHKLFQYGYLKGMASASENDKAARRLCAFWFTNLVGNGLQCFSGRIEAAGTHR